MSEPESPGAALRAARNAMGYSVAEVAARLKVPTNVVENIEADKFDALRAKVFIRAYIRSYADLVQLDPNAMLWAYDQNTDPEQQSPETKTRPLSTVRRVLVDLVRMPRGQSWVFAGTVILIAALAGVFLWLAWPSDVPIASAVVGQPNGEASQQVSIADEMPRDFPVAAELPASFSDQPAPNGPAESAPNGPAESVPTGPSDSALDDPAEPAPSEPAEPAPNEPIEPASGDPTPVPVPGDPPGDLPTGPTEGVLDGLTEDVSAQPVILSNPLTYVPGDDHELVFRFTDDCWVQVLDASGSLLHEDLERAEGELELRGDAPFTITLGYAPGVQLEYNGERVMLTQHTHENLVAKMVLGL